MIAIAAILSLVFGAAASGAFPKGAVVDRTHPFSTETIFWPTEGVDGMAVLGEVRRRVDVCAAVLGRRELLRAIAIIENR
jgi:hypothetical protein